MSRPSSTIVLVDADIAGDRRVQRVVAEAAGPVQVVDLRAVRSPGPLAAVADGVRAIGLMLAGLRRPLARQRRLTGSLGRGRRHGVCAGLRGCWRWTLRAVRAARVVGAACAGQAAPVIHANDLACGLAASLAARPPGTAVIYDAHELEIQRNRETGWLRILIEHQHEALALAAASEVRTVNAPIASAMRDWHQLAAPPRVVPNDLYRHHDLPPAPAVGPPALAFVGSGVRGRRLELLDRPPEQLGFTVHVWLLGADLPPGVAGARFRYGPDDYEASLADLARRRRTLMWCCVDSGVLSYRLATPNKLFQALAMGIPVVATPGTYLAELVAVHGIGAVSDGGDLRALSAQVLSGSYLDWCANVRRLRAALRAGTVEI